MSNELTINSIPAIKRCKLADIIAELGHLAMTRIMESFANTKYANLSYKSIVSRHGRCEDALAAEHFLSDAGMRLLPIDVLVEHIKCVTDQAKSVTDWLIANGYYTNQHAVYPAPPSHVEPMIVVNPLQQANDLLRDQINALNTQLKTSCEKIQVLETSLRIVENENIDLRNQVVVLQNQVKDRTARVDTLTLPSTPGNNGTSGKKYLHELSDLDIQWIVDEIGSNQDSLKIGIFMQRFHNDICISVDKIKAKFGYNASQYETLRLMIKEITRYEKVTLSEFVQTLLNIHLVSNANSLRRHFNV
ncbi:hypothetical protein E24_00477 [Faustovirus]|nr:hypothetical protein PRJ_Fausto_00448 [Faustovirus]AMN83390.1 hypothetical protein E24_00477 [Faustovirus]AMN84374.1 hypothetical protein D5a_00475 [Faustovirus]AMN85360.1 hypothetical protein E23_00477 [Faustovirus]QBR99353.1 hypothetical protein [Faustovirus mariensis]